MVVVSGAATALDTGLVESTPKPEETRAVRASSGRLTRWSAMPLRAGAMAWAGAGTVQCMPASVKAAANAAWSERV